MFKVFKSKKRKDLEFISSILKSCAEGEYCEKISEALKTLNVHLKTEYDNTKYCVEVTVVIVRKIIEKYGTDLNKNYVDDDIFTAGFFCFVISNHITRIVKSEFETVSTLAVLDLFGFSKAIEISNYINPIADMYNEIADAKLITALGQNFVKWIENPTDEQFDKMIQLYGICKKSIRQK